MSDTAHSVMKQYFIDRLLWHDYDRHTKDIVAWLETTDFYTAPASTKFHGAHFGGLLDHSVNVYRRAINLRFSIDPNIPEDSIAIAALLHDVCKIGMYKKTVRNVKSYDKEDFKDKVEYIKQDSGGFYIWKQVDSYMVDEDFKFGGHGAKSVYLISKYLKLTDEEAAAINSHMGVYQESKIMQENVGPVYENNSLAFLLHISDETSTYIDHI